MPAQPTHVFIGGVDAADYQLHAAAATEAECRAALTAAIRKVARANGESPAQAVRDLADALWTQRVPLGGAYLYGETDCIIDPTRTARR